MERTIEVAGLTDDLISRLDERASQIGLDRNSYLRRLIERAVAPPTSAAPLAELLAPVHDYTDARGISEPEIERFFDAQLTDVRRNRRNSDQGGKAH